MLDRVVANRGDDFDQVTGLYTKSLRIGGVDPDRILVTDLIEPLRITAASVDQRR